MFRIEALPDRLNVGLVSAFQVDFLVKDLFTEAHFQFWVPLFGAGWGHF